MRCVTSVGLVAVLALTLGVRAEAAQAPVRISVAEQYLFAAANAERSQRGLAILRWDAGLYRAAEAHDREMVARASISHQYPGEADLSQRGRVAGVRFSVIAENVAEASTAVRIHDAWMQSAGHRENLLDPKVDSVGIRVMQRDGQLYAVEDFARVVADVPLAEQERVVGALVADMASGSGGGGIALLPATDEARQSCAMDTGYAGERQPVFVMRYTTPDLNVLPAPLTKTLGAGGYREAMVGACAARGAGEFSTYSLVVMLYR
jgi:hypothetical protein